MTVPHTRLTWTLEGSKPPAMKLRRRAASVSTRLEGPSLVLPSGLSWPRPGFPAPSPMAFSIRRGIRRRSSVHDSAVRPLRGGSGVDWPAAQLRADHRRSNNPFAICWCGSARRAMDSVLTCRQRSDRERRAHQRPRRRQPVPDRPRSCRRAAALPCVAHGLRRAGRARRGGLRRHSSRSSAARLPAAAVAELGVPRRSMRSATPGWARPSRGHPHAVAGTCSPFSLPLGAGRGTPKDAPYRLNASRCLAAVLLPWATMPTPSCSRRQPQRSAGPRPHRQEALRMRATRSSRHIRTSRCSGCRLRPASMRRLLVRD